MTRRKQPAADSPEAGEVADNPAADATSDPVIEVPTEPEPEPSVQEPALPPEPASTPVPARRLGVFGPLLGGALAALGGFGLSHFNALGLAAPDRAAEITALGQRLDASVAAFEGAQSGAESALRKQIDDLSARIAAIESAPTVDLSGLADLDQRLRVIEALPAEGGASSAALASKLAELERKVAELAAGGAGTAEVDAALARLAAAEAEAQSRAAEAAALAEAAAKARAREALSAAVQSGAGFEAELAAVADPELQSALASHVQGVVPLMQLQADFPDLARETLQLARAKDSEAGWAARLVDFLAAQTGARSLTPRGGDDPDAILSRAEFALGEGRLSDALAELGGLEAELQAPFAGWITAATARVAVDAALAEAL